MSELYAEIERLTRENAELLKATGVIEAGLLHEIERLTRTTVNQRNELARLTFDNNHTFKATAKLQIEIERLRAALIAWHEACDDEEREWARERGLKALSQEPKP